MRRRFAKPIVAFALILSSSLLLGQAEEEREPKSLAAKSAVLRATRAADVAKETYRKAMAEIKAGQLAELKIALNAATKSGDLNEANAINRLIIGVEIEHAAYTKQSQRMQVAANKDWQPIGLVVAGKYRIRAEGKWTANPSTGMYTADGWGGRQEGKLKCRLGDRVLFLGTDTMLTIGADFAGNVLEFRIHDGGLKDNKGELTVTVEPVAADPVVGN